MLRKISVVGSQPGGGFYIPDPETTLCMLMQLLKICHTVLRYKIASTKLLLKAARLLTKVSTDCKVGSRHSISQL